LGGDARDIAGSNQNTPMSEMYDPDTGAFHTAGRLETGRAGHTATLLPDGSVLIAGGSRSLPNGAGECLASAELYSTITQTSSDLMARMKAMTCHQHTATLLGSGKVLIVGRGNVTQTSSGLTAPCAAQLFSPTTKTFDCTKGMTQSHMNHTATLLPDGMVMVAGGVTEEEVVLNGGFSSKGVITSAAEVYDAATGTFQPVPSMMYARYGHTATLLSSGEVLIVGGRDEAGALREAEIFHP